MWIGTSREGAAAAVVRHPEVAQLLEAQTREGQDCDRVAQVVLDGAVEQRRKLDVAHRRDQPCRAVQSHWGLDPTQKAFSKPEGYPCGAHPAPA